MTYFVVGLLLAAAVVAWWVAHRAAGLRRECEAREARVMEALFAARQSANGGANIDVEQIFGVGAASASASADAVLRSAGLEPELIAMLGSQAAAEAADKLPSSAEREKDMGTRRTQPPQDDEPARMVPGVAAPVPVRDLVQVFYEARGFRAAAADAGARPIEFVLTHKADANRSYAFAPLDGPLSIDLAREIAARARAIGRPRVLISSESALAQTLVEALSASGVRLLDGAAIEAQLARLDAPLANKVRSVAARLAASRMSSG